MARMTNDQKLAAATDRFIKRHVTHEDVPEAKIEQFYNGIAEKYHWWQRKFKSQYSGDPDRIYIRDGECFFIEFKRKGKKPTQKQLEIHEELRMQGMTVWVIDHIDALLAEVIFL